MLEGGNESEEIGRRVEIYRADEDENYEDVEDDDEEDDDEDEGDNVDKSLPTYALKALTLLFREAPNQEGEDSKGREWRWREEGDGRRVKMVGHVYYGIHVLPTPG